MFKYTFLWLLYWLLVCVCVATSRHAYAYLFYVFFYPLANTWNVTWLDIGSVIDRVIHCRTQIIRTYFRAIIKLNGFNSLQCERCGSRKQREQRVLLHIRRSAQCN